MIQDRVSKRWGIDVEKSHIREAIRKANREAFLLSRPQRDNIGKRLAELICRDKATEPYHTVRTNEMF